MRVLSTWSYVSGAFLMIREKHKYKIWILSIEGNLKNKVFCQIDDGKATLRILNTLDRGGTKASRGQLEEMLERAR